MNFRWNTLNRLGAMFASITLLLSFGLHAVQVEHEHYGALAVEHTHVQTAPEESSPQSNTVFAPLSDLMHHSKDEWLLLFIVSAYLSVILTARTWLLEHVRQTLMVTITLGRHTTSGRRQRDHLVLALASGNLNPKPF